MAIVLIGGDETAVREAVTTYQSTYPVDQQVGIEGITTSDQRVVIYTSENGSTWGEVCRLHEFRSFVVEKSNSKWGYCRYVNPSKEENADEV